MPPKHTYDLSIGETTYRLHRLRGKRAFKARTELVGICGETATLLLGSAVMTPEQAAELRVGGRQQKVVMLALMHNALRAGKMTAAAVDNLTAWYVHGHVEIIPPGEDAKAIMIERDEDLDQYLDRSGCEDDALVWSTILWTQIPHCLGPIIAAAGG
jgi:hypothetical protein